MKRTINIDGIAIGDGEPVFVIAEAGVNHNGDPALAMKLMEAAHEAGAQCVKFQTFKADAVVAPDAPKAAYQLETTNPQESQLEMLRKLELPESAYADLLTFAAKHHMTMLSTPYSTDDVDFLDEIGIPAFKLASISIAEPYFLEYTARKGKPMIVSSGMATLEEVALAVEAIRSTGNDDFVVLQCTTNYPSRIEDTNLRAMLTMRDAFDVLVGYSDHTLSDTACIGAVTLGACLIEKHFTLDVQMEGPDHACSTDPVSFKRLTRHIREAELMLGSGKKEPSDAETKNAPGMRRSIFAKRPIKKGEVIGPDLLTFKRPATGLSPVLMDRLVGRVALRDISVDQPVALEAVEIEQ